MKIPLQISSPRASQAATVCFLPYVSSKKVVAKISMILCNLEREREKEDVA
jgi:hypothetical protein